MAFPAGHCSAELDLPKASHRATIDMGGDTDNKEMVMWGDGDGDVDGDGDDDVCWPEPWQLVLQVAVAVAHCPENTEGKYV